MYRHLVVKEDTFKFIESIKDYLNLLDRKKKHTQNDIIVQLLETSPLKPKTEEFLNKIR